MEINLKTFDIYSEGLGRVHVSRKEIYIGIDSKKTGIYCFSDDAISIIEKLQTRIAELEAEKG